MPEHAEPEAVPPRAIAERALGAAVIALAALRAWRSAHTMNPDGVSYLDLSDRLLAGDWAHFVQGYWSPALPAILGLARRIFGEGAAVEFEIAHGVLFLAVCAALAAWSLLLRECDLTLRAASPSHGARFGAPAIRFTAHAAFAWTVLWLCAPEILTPDLLLVTLVLAASALLLRVRRTGAGALPLGLTLGAAYLVKFVALPLGFLFVFLAVLPNRAARWPILARAVLGFALVGAPWIGALSARSGALNAGNAGRLNYGWYVARVGSQTPRADPMPGGARWTRVLDHPVVYTFGDGAFGTYPAWSDPAHWSAAPRPPFSLRLQAVALARESRRALTTLLLLVLTLGVAALLPVRERAASGNLGVLGLLSLAGIGMYALVHVEHRLLAPFAPLAACALLGRISAPERPGSRRATISLVACGVFATGVFGPIIGLEFLLWRVGAPTADTVAVSITQSTSDLVAHAGAPPGTRVAVIGPAQEATGLQRRARLSVAAEVPSESAPSFWNAPAKRQECVLQVLFDAGARAVLAVRVFPDSLGPPWTNVSRAVAVRPLAERPRCAAQPSMCGDVICVTDLHHNVTTTSVDRPVKER